MMVNDQQTEREAYRIQANREEFVERLTWAGQADEITQLLDGVYLFRQSRPMNLIPGTTKPILCVTAQGSKEITLGDSSYVYDSSNYLITTMELPCVGRILEASEDRPYLSLVMDLPASLVGSVLVEANHVTVRHSNSDLRAINVSPLDADLLDAIVRLIRLQDTPTRADVLLPLIQREIIYYLLLGNQGGRLSHLMSLGSCTPHITKAIQQIRQNFDKPLRVEELAQELSMSVSSFHHHFKAITAMSPVQFQKQLRLQAARRLILSGEFDAASAAYQVGYNDPSHFGRDYKSLFGDSPIHDVQRLREEAIEIYTV